ncbi:MAG: 2-oxoglutarate dehydrogenase complex dihydrolipoyllysine-residue succinyltransferase [Pseudarcicella sp.]|nr:2-oxoglutarate dehydrogenase complex dihydrolipoyllysine-residue succinyltransferase [Pseudarcicella sp.]MBP6410907.1 2-oxoglutarate dehydrogenase complex dihydrolipoyllysine-residue succinyltransferase [Pseudarcicella sp.]
MAIEMKVPPVGESITEVTIAAWSKKDGDIVKMDDVLCELESDKATFELTAETDGILSIVAKEGDTIAIGELVCRISPAESTQNTATATTKEEKSVEKPASSSQPASTLEIKVPAVGESISEVTISSWNKKEGDFVKMDEILCELESDKATFELPAESSGILHIVAQSGTTLAIGALVATITSSGSETPSAPSEKSSASSPTVTESTSTNKEVSYANGHASPAAAKVLSEKGIDAQNVSGTGIGGRITKEDAQNASLPKANRTTAEAQTITTPAGNRNERSEKMSSLRKTVAKRLVQVKNETAMLTTFNEVDMKPIMDLRAKYKDKFKEKHGVGLGFMSFFTKAVCEALKLYPAVNASIDGESIIFHDYCDISIAVSAPKGLVVPVIRNAENLSLAGIESEVMRLALKARDNKLTLPEMTGGTFTITNGGVFGSMLSTPIINAPQSAILGMHNIVERPVAINGEVVIRPIMYVALSYDHRIIDGRESVSFLVKLKQLLEDPTALLLDI